MQTALAPLRVLRNIDYAPACDPQFVRDHPEPNFFLEPRQTWLNFLGTESPRPYREPAPPAGERGVRNSDRGRSGFGPNTRNATQGEAVRPVYAAPLRYRRTVINFSRARVCAMSYDDC